MVGFICSSPSAKEEEEREELIKNQSKLDDNKGSNDPFDFSLPEIDDFSLPFTDSFFDFDSIKEWLEEDPPIGVLSSMDDIGAVKNDYGVDDRCTEMASNEFPEKPNVTGDHSVRDEDEKVETLDCVSQEKSDFSVEQIVEKVKVEEKCCSRDDGEKFETSIDFVQERNELVLIEKSIEHVSGGFLEEIELDKRKLGTVGCSITEELGKVNLNGGLNKSDLVGVGRSETIIGGVAAVEAKSMESDSVTDGICGVENSDGHETGKKEVDGSGSGSEDESESESESESSSSSDSGSSSLSDSSSDTDDEEETQKEVDSGKAGGGEMEIEEGEIMASEADEMIAWTDEDDEDAAGGNAVREPIRSKNEIAVLPPVPAVNVTLLPHHQTLPVGIISSVIGTQVIVEGVEKHNPLNEGSILWITKSRSPLGVVDEIFGPVKNPYYIVRYNSETEVPAGIQHGTLISFVPEFANHVLNNDNLYKKGYDASGENDEELSEEAEFSDDEKEAEYRRMQKMKKRGSNDEKVENRKQDKKNKNRKFKNRFGAGNFDQASGKQAQASSGTPPTQPDQHFNQSPEVTSDIRQVLSGGPIPSHPFTRLGQAPGVSGPSSNAWFNGAPCQQAPSIAGLPGGAQMQGIPWLQVNHPQQLYQPPFPNAVTFQQQSNMNSLPPNLVALGGQPSFGAGPAFAPWPGSLAQNVLNQSMFGMAMHGQHAPTLGNVGANTLSTNGSQPIFTSNSGQEAFQNHNHSSQRGGGRKSNWRGGGRFGSGRGRRSH